MPLFRRLRAIAVTGVFWGIIWAIASVAPTVAFWLFKVIPHGGGNVSMFIRIAATVAMFLGVIGALCGVCFGLLFANAEHDREIEALSRRRASTLGGIAGLVMTCMVVWALGLAFHEPMPLFLASGIAATSTVLGAIVAGGSVAVAQRAELPARMEPLLQRGR